MFIVYLPPLECELVGVKDFIYIIQSNIPGKQNGILCISGT
jgi:hypothetical protein